MDSLFSRFFPVPRLLSMEGGGLEISERSIKYLRIARKHLGRRVAVYGEEPLAQGVIVQGEIKDKQSLIAALAAVRSRCGFSFAHVSLPEQRGYIYDVAVSREGTLRDQILLSLPAHVPLSPAEAVFDCETIFKESDATILSAVATVFPESVAQLYADALIASAFMPLSFELEPQAAARAITSRMEQTRTGAHLLIDIGVTKTLFCVIQNGVPRFTTSAGGSAALDEALQKAGADVQKIKLEQGLTEGGEYVEHFKKVARKVADETKRLAVYWNASAAEGSFGKKHDPLQSIILYGGNANIRKLSEHLSQESGIPAMLADLRLALTGKRESVPPIPKKESVRYATAIGLALRVEGTAIW